MTNQPPEKRRKVGLLGSECSWAKLTEQQVFEIREKHAHGASRPALAAEYKVCRKTIWEIVNWKTWAWVGNEHEIARIRAEQNARKVA